MTSKCNPSSDELRTKAQTLADNLTALADNTNLPVETRSRALDELSGDVDQTADEIRTARDAGACEVNERAAWLGGQGPTLLRQAGIDISGMSIAEQQAQFEELRQQGDLPGFARRDGRREWRNLFPTADEYRALIAEGTPSQGGYSVPQQVAGQWIEKLRNRSVFLAAPGINVVPFRSASFRIPSQLATSAPSPVAEGATIPKADMTFGALDFNAIKFGAIYQATSEILEDSSLPLEALVQQSMIEDMAVKVDFDAFQGAGGVAGLAGISSTAANNNATTLAAGKTAVTWDDVLDAYISVVATGQTPTVVWCSMDQYKSLIKSRENGATGAYLAGSVTTDPTNKAWGLPILPSANLPARTVIVADASRIYIGVRREIIVHRSDEYGYGEDLVSWRATSRWAGIRVAEASSVQKIVAAAS